MSEKLILQPGQLTLADLRKIYRGVAFSINPAAQSEVDKAAQIIAAILQTDDAVYGVNTGFGKLAQQRIANRDLVTLQQNLILSHASGVGPPLADAIVRLILALKISSLARGASGVRWRLIAALQKLFDADMLPIIPAQGSVGASGDLAPLAHLSATLLGHGTVKHQGQEKPTQAAFQETGIEVLVLQPKEGLALINGTQVSTALALAGLFEIERVFQAALVTGALAVDAALGSDTPFDARIHELRGQTGQIDVAAVLRTLLADSVIRSSHIDCGKVQDPYSLRCQPQVMGACLDLLRQVSQTLEREANAVTDNPLVFADTHEVISGGNFHAEPVAFAADVLALAVAEIGSLAERRIAMLVDGSISGLPSFLTENAGINSGFMIAHVTAAALAAENKQLSHPASVDSLPTSANQEDHVSMATHGARRLFPMSENTAHIIAIELLAAAQGIDYHAPLTSSPRLEQVRTVLRAQVPQMRRDRFLAPDIAIAKQLVSQGILAQAAGSDCLPF